MNLGAAAQTPVWASPGFLSAATASLLAHALAIALLNGVPPATRPKPDAAPEPVQVTLLQPVKPKAVEPPPAAKTPVPTRNTSRLIESATQSAPAAMTAPAEQPRQPASMKAPAPPSAEEWQLASTYKLKNSKRYRYSWAQQVRSMMGTAVEGPDQGDVRFQVEIAPDGRLVSLQTLWTTSATAERLARQALSHMPPLPPTPNGKPLIFETTIAFQPRETGWPPIYKDDCLPDPPGFKNPFAWNGSGSPALSMKTTAASNESDATAEVDENCLKGLPKDSLEAVSASVERQFKTWGSLPLNGVK